ncbi:MAG TPA: twin-arginine translocase TatA/TatE family subunit [Candidatus Binataceae bacterium]|nr:twin-arginine translocase TatA/TatE family subunit [Candidatus Binataceae bacterium]
MGIFEIILILIVALIVLGPEQMPELVRSGIRVYREIRTAANDVIQEISESLNDPPPPLDQTAEPLEPPFVHRENLDTIGEKESNGVSTAPASEPGLPSPPNPADKPPPFHRT